MFSHLLSMLGLVPTFQKTKCKRLLNTTMERIKLLKKRHEAQLRQLDGDVIELLQRGKEDKVQPWLKRIWKEQWLSCVYAKIADYCESVQVNLKDIAEQRECPSGLKEAIAGLCFAASCCADLPELQELRDIFAMKYGKKFVNAALELQPSSHVNPQFSKCLCAKGPSEEQKRALLEGIVTQYNMKQGHEQEDTESFGEAKECNYQLQEGTDGAMKASEVEDQSESKDSQEVDSVQESNHIESSTVCKEDLGSNEPANRKRTLEDRETNRAAFKRAHRRRRFWLNKYTVEEEENGGIKEHADQKTADTAHEGRWGEGCDDLPPPPPPKRAPPPVPSPQLMLPMPSFSNDNRGIANPSLPISCSTMANNYFLETYGSHVHPRLPKYEDLVANFTARKH